LVHKSISNSFAASLERDAKNGYRFFAKITL